MNVAVERIRVMIVDDHPLVRDGLRAHISGQSDLEVCGEAESEAAALELVLSAKPDVVIVDLSLKQGSGIDLIRHLVDLDPPPLMLVFSMHDEDIYAERAVRAGARGFVSKQAEPARLVEAIRRVSEGQFFLSDRITQRMMDRASIERSPAAAAVEDLTDRELDVFRHLGHGRSVQEIAESMGIRPKTVETYRDRIRRKLDVPNGRQLARRAVAWVTEHDG